MLKRYKSVILVFRRLRSFSFEEIWKSKRKFLFSILATSFFRISSFPKKFKEVLRLLLELPISDRKMKIAIKIKVTRYFRSFIRNMIVFNAFPMKFAFQVKTSKFQILSLLNENNNFWEKWDLCDLLIKWILGHKLNWKFEKVWIQNSVKMNYESENGQKSQISWLQNKDPK